MATSQNGYVANDQSRTQVWKIPGTDRTVRLRKGAPGELLVEFAARFHTDVEPIDTGVYDDWGYAERTIRGSSTTLSNHASGTALDLNATKHPLGVKGTFTAAQTRRIHAILDEFDGCLRWGGDYQNRVDSMHVEVVASPERCEATLRKLRSSTQPKEDDMPITDADLVKIRKVVRDEISKFVGDVVAVDPTDVDYDEKNATVRVSTALTRIMRRTGKAPGA